MAFTKLTKSVLNVSALPDRVNNQAQLLKATFDQAGVDIKEAHNTLIDELESVTSAEMLGAKTQTGEQSTIQNELNNIFTSITGKVEKIEGKQLSTEDYTTEEKEKLKNIEANANNYTLPEASTTMLGGIKVDGSTIVVENGVAKAKAADAADYTARADIEVLKETKADKSYVVESLGDIEGDLYTVDRYNEITSEYSEFEPAVKSWSKNIGYNLPGSGNTTAIAYGNGIYVAVNWGGQIYTSDDGINWTRRKTISDSASVIIKYLEFGNGVFVAGTDYKVFVSEDGITWSTGINNGISNGTRTLRFVNDKFVTVGNGIIGYSTDGYTWTNGSVNDTSKKFNDIAYGDGVYVLVGNNGVIYTSNDLVTFTARTGAGTTNFETIAYGSGRFIAVPKNSSGGYYSKNGVEWAYINAKGTGGYIASDGKNFVVYGDGIEAYSEDGITFYNDSFYKLSYYAVNSFHFFYKTGLKFSSGKWLGITAYGTIITSGYKVDIQSNLPLTSYEKNKIVKFKFEAENKLLYQPTININNLGKKTINGELKSGENYNLVYNGENFDIQKCSKVIWGTFTSIGDKDRIYLPFKPDFVLVFSESNMYGNSIGIGSSNATEKQLVKIIDETYLHENGFFNPTSASGTKLHYIAIKL